MKPIQRMNDALTFAVQALIASLPAPPEVGGVQASNIWIVEWLPDGDRQTGKELHEWMKHRRAGWSVHLCCRKKSELIEAIHNATRCAQRFNRRPVLHIESHGDESGLEGPDGSGGNEMLTWDELTEPLQLLNLATHCNLIVFIAACVGFAGIQALQRGPRAPAVALVGPDANLSPRNLLQGTKEFYRRWLGTDPSLTESAQSASREAGEAIFEPEPFALHFYETLVESLTKSMRPIERRERVARIRQKMILDGQFSMAEIESRLACLPLLRPWWEMQNIWDEMFMIDLYPENRTRFGLDMKAIIERITARDSLTGGRGC